MAIEDEIEAAGHARVFVVLKRTKRRRINGRLTVALDETISRQQEAAQSIEKYFRPFKNSRMAQMTRELASTSQRTIRSMAAPESPMLAGLTDYVRDLQAEVVAKANGVRYFPYLGIMMGTVDRAGLAGLRENTDDVERLFSPPEFTLIRPVEDNDAALAGPGEGTSWCLERMGIPRLWDAGLTGTGVLIGHLDTGIDSTHPALENAIDAYAVFDEIGQQLNVVSPMVDTGYHGTHTAGLLVGKPFQGLTFGVAPDAGLAAGTIIEGGDVPARIAAGLNWCVGQGVKIISLSVGVRAYEPLLAALLGALRDRDILPVVAIGNEGPDSSRTPGNLSQSLSVGAIDENDQIWFDSSSQQFVETPKRIVPTVIAPGVGVWSSAPGGKLKRLSGTSMAAPHVAGLAALLKQYRPEATATQLEKAIIASCTRPLGISSLRGNKGVPDALLAKSEL
jgi:subtilisin